MGCGLVDSRRLEFWSVLSVGYKHLLILFPLNRFVSTLEFPNFLATSNLLIRISTTLFTCEYSRSVRLLKVKQSCGSVVKRNVLFVKCQLIYCRSQVKVRS